VSSSVSRAKHLPGGVRSAQTLGLMKSADLLTLHDIVQECLLVQMIGFFGIMFIGLFSWAVNSAFGNPTEQPIRLALVAPFFFSAIHGVIAIYWLRYKHGISSFHRYWWPKLAIVSLAWSVGLIAIGLGIEYFLAANSFIPGEPRSLHDIGLALAYAAGSALLFSLMPTAP
jgi:hypothetical protein